MATDHHDVSSDTDGRWVCSCGYTASTLRATRRHATMANKSGRLAALAESTRDRH